MSTKTNRFISTIIFFLFSLLFEIANAEKIPDAVYFDKSVPQVSFAVADIVEAISIHGNTKQLELKTFRPTENKIVVVIATGMTQCSQIAKTLKIELPNLTEEQSYALRMLTSEGKVTCVVFGFDANGAMYGALDVAEALRIGAFSKLTNCDKKPYISNRGIKFNIPLDLRTPSYSDCSDAAQANIPNMWDMDFWKEMLNNMARHRYNLISLWNLHPFPSMTKVPEFPDVALNDVWRTTIPLTDDFSYSGSDFVKPEMLAKHEVLKKMTIDQKIKFWQDVMQFGKDRGISFYIFTWNIFTYGAEGKYGITCDPSNDVTINYFRASVREMITTYPLLAGIGITAGENMMKSTKYTNEQWLWKTYGEGINDGLKLQPDRKFRLIHRFHFTGQSEILNEFKDLSCPIDFSFKYSIAHMYSMTNPPFIKELLPILAKGKKTWLTVRNDDIYSFRWGDPDYARDYITSIPSADKIAGFYMGPDGYIWGREYLSKEPESPHQTIIEKQWYSFMLWGRLSYDPSISNKHFEQILGAHFPEVPSGNLFKASQEASRIFPEITRFFWGDIDINWLPEACCHGNSIFYTVANFITQPVMPESGNLTIIDWREKVRSNAPMNGKTPIQVAESLKQYATNTLKLLTELKSKQGNNKELRLTLGDYEAFADLGNYYAEKILGASDLALYDATSDTRYQLSAINHLEKALVNWEKYASVYTSQYVQPVMYNRVKLVDIPGKFMKEVSKDIEIVRNWKPGSIQKEKIKGATDNPFRP